jgi:hypothetical protein
MTTDRPKTIAEVVAAFDEVVAWAERASSPIGYFPALHREVALAIGSAIADGTFDDGSRMEAMVAAFANRYLDALHAFQTHGQPSRVWTLAFEQSSDESLTVVQHVLLAMTAHIGLDLGIVTASIAPGDELAGVRADFERINIILRGLVDIDRLAVDGVSPRLRDLDRFGDIADRFVSDVIDDTREHAWQLATILAPLAEEARAPVVAAADAHVTQWGERIAKPELVLRVFLRDVVRPAEAKVPAVIARLELDPTARRNST